MPGFVHPRHVLRELGVSARKRLSQNFICQPSLAERIARLPRWPAGTEIVEVGGGTGVLTDALAERFRDVLVIEVDRALVGYLRQRFEGGTTHPGSSHTDAEPGTPLHPGTPEPPRPGTLPGDDGVVTVVEADARTLDLALVRRPPVGVFGNLPYALTTELFMWLVRQRRSLAGAVIMVQREYADRLVARPSSKAYGSLSVFAATHVDVVARFPVGPGVFYPEPKVGSTVLHLAFHEPPEGVDTMHLERVVRAAFAHRRKLMRTNLQTGLDLSSERVTKAIETAGASAGARAEELTPEAFVALARALS